MAFIKDNLLTTAIVLLGIFTGVAAAQSCSWVPNGKVLKFADPPASNKRWSKQFVRWANLPVRVRVEGSMWQLMARDTYRAVETWNKAIGCKVFNMSYQEDAEVVVAFKAQPEDENWAATAKYVVRKNKKWGRYWGSDINVYVIHFGDQVTRDNIMTHELGHALGLADLKGDPGMLMYGVTSGGMHVDKEELDILNALYCAK
jgi:predicted Zn-dependent protease